MSELEHIAAQLDAHPDYRVLRRLAPVNIDAVPDPAWRKASAQNITARIRYSNRSLQGFDHGFKDSSPPSLRRQN